MRTQAAPSGWPSSCQSLPEESKWKSSMAESCVPFLTKDTMGSFHVNVTAVIWCFFANPLSTKGNGMWKQKYFASCWAHFSKQQRNLQGTASNQVYGVPKLWGRQPIFQKFRSENNTTRCVWDGYTLTFLRQRVMECESGDLSSSPRFLVNYLWDPSQGT